MYYENYDNCCQKDINRKSVMLYNDTLNINILKNNILSDIEQGERDEVMNININLPSFFASTLGMDNELQISNNRNNIINLIVMYIEMSALIIERIIRQIKILEAQFNLDIPWRRLIKRINEEAYGRFQNEIER